MKTVLRISLICLAVIVAAGSFLTESSAQKRKFSHSTAAHQKKSCNSCHSNPTSNWVSARGFPDVADFPPHVSCFACHKSDIFSGNMPVFCGGCHTVVGPKGKARFAFPNKSRPTQFATIFPHNVHQDVIATNDRPVDTAVANIIFASFRLADDKPKFNNCAICHQTPAALPKFGTRGPKSTIQPLTDASPDNFAPTAKFFKTMPGGHESCFTCHFQGLKPSGIDCAKCHKLEPPHTDSNVVKRYSLKYSHEQLNAKGENVHNRDCMTCHIRISQNSDLKTLVDADVPFFACISCHSDNFTKENNKRAESIASKQPAFQCIYCHTTGIGRFPIPQSHRNQ